MAGPRTDPVGGSADVASRTFLAQITPQQRLLTPLTEQRSLPARANFMTRASFSLVLRSQRINVGEEWLILQQQRRWRLLLLLLLSFLRTDNLYSMPDTLGCDGLAQARITRRKAGRLCVLIRNNGNYLLVICGDGAGPHRTTEIMALRYLRKVT